MKRIFYILIFTCIYSFHSCIEKYPTEYTNDLPFGLEYNMSESEAYFVIDSLSKAGIVEILTGDSNKFYYNLIHNDEETELLVTLQFYNDSLYEVDVRDGIISLNERNKKEYMKAISFFKGQEINLNSYERVHKPYSNKYDYDYKKHPYEITLYSEGGMIIIFTNEQVQKLIDEEEKQMLRTIKKDGGEFCKSIMDISTGIYKATITDAGFLVIGVRPINNPNFDYFAQSYLEQALNAGIQIKGCFVVDIDKSTWLNGAVKGERIGKAYR